MGGTVSRKRGVEDVGLISLPEKPAFFLVSPVGKHQKHCKQVLWTECLCPANSYVEILNSWCDSIGNGGSWVGDEVMGTEPPQWGWCLVKGP